ncbi:MAG: sensor histidine kinase, partial [Lachnospiraceae bacterium]|nr:sensor histidine kinase [Lachnospiraceae bacterium]
MKQTLLTKSALQTMLVITGTIILCLIGLSVVTQYDNKYITKAASAQGHLYVIPEKGYCSLVDGWEFYPDALLLPNDFSSETLPYYSTWAGEYPNMALFHEDHNPYGAATWRRH